MRGPELGVEDPREGAPDVVGLGGPGIRGLGHQRHTNKNRIALENMPDWQVPSRQMDVLAVLKALGDETRFSMYRELASSTRAAHCRRARRPPRGARQHRAPPPRAPARCGPGRRRAGATGARSGGRSTSTRWRPGRPGLGFDPPSYTLLAGLLAALAERVGADGDEATAIGRSWGLEAGKRTRSKSCVKALGGRAGTTRVRARRRARRPRRRHRILVLPVPGAGRGLSRARLQPPPRDLRRGRRRGRRGKRGGLLDVVRP